MHRDRVFFSLYGNSGSIFPVRSEAKDLCVAKVFGTRVYSIVGCVREVGAFNDKPGIFQLSIAAGGEDAFFDLNLNVYKRILLIFVL